MYNDILADIDVTDEQHALRAFVDTINATSGIFIDPTDGPCPVGAPEWPDLGVAYLHACAALGVEPVLVTSLDS